MSRFTNWKPPIFDDEGYACERMEFNRIGYGVEYYPGKRYGWKCQYPENLKLGKDVDIGCFTYLNAKYGITIGDNVQIGSHCSIYSDNTENDTHGEVTIGENTLIGSHSLILPNAHIPSNGKYRAYSVIKPL